MLIRQKVGESAVTIYDDHDVAGVQTLALDELTNGLGGQARPSKGHNHGDDRLLGHP